MKTACFNTGFSGTFCLPASRAAIHRERVYVEKLTRKKFKTKTQQLKYRALKSMKGLYNWPLHLIFRQTIVSGLEITILFSWVTSLRHWSGLFSDILYRRPRVHNFLLLSVTVFFSFLFLLLRFFYISTCKFVIHILYFEWYFISESAVL